MITRGDRITERQKQCCGCQYLSSVWAKDGKGRLRDYAFCTAQNKRLCDMDIWKDCNYYEPK